MNQKAVFGGQEYHLIEQLSALGEDKTWILCVDAAGNRYVCPKELWLQNALSADRFAPVHTGSSSQEKIEFFLSMFRGRTDIYARHYLQKRQERADIPFIKRYGITTASRLIMI